MCLAPGDVDVRLGWNPISQGSGLILVLVAVLAGDSCVITSSTPTFQELVDVVETFKVEYIAETGSINPISRLNNRGNTETSLQQTLIRTARLRCNDF